MTAVRLTGIGELVTHDPVHDGTPIGVIRDAAVVVRDLEVARVGRSDRCVLLWRVLLCSGHSAPPATTVRGPTDKPSVRRSHPVENAPQVVAVDACRPASHRDNRRKCRSGATRR